METKADGGMMTALYLIYVDNLKDIIMEYGLHVGEAALKSVANRLYGVLSEGRFFARLEGEMFGLLQEGVDHTGHVHYLVRRIMEVLAEPLSVMSHDIQANVSIGVALCPVHGKDFESLYANACGALEAARQDDGSAYNLCQ